MKKTIALYSLLFCSVAVAQGPRGGGGGFRPMGGPGSHVVVTGAPYSGIETVQSQETLADGNKITHKRQTTVYRDALGRMRTEETVNGQTTVTIVDPVAGVRYVLDSATMTAYQSPGPRTRPAGSQTRTPPPPRDGATIVTTNLGTQSINGVAATGTQITETIAAGAIGNAQPIQIVRITWIANDLKIPVQIKSSDPRFGTTDMELTNITTSDPAASLFIVPAGYTVKTGGMGQGGMGPGGMGQGRMGRSGPPR